MDGFSIPARSASEGRGRIPRSRFGLVALASEGKGTAMTETQALLGKITALRQRLEQAQKLASEANSAATQLLGAPAPLAVLQRRVGAAVDHDAVVDAVARAVAPPPEA